MSSQSKAPRALRARVALLLLALGLHARSAHALLPEDRLQLSMYGRVGLAWDFRGNVIQGKSMNLTNSSVGGRLEEGDYIEPTLKIRPLLGETAEDPYADIYVTPAMYARGGSFISALTSNNPKGTLAIELFQAYIKTGNLFIPGLDFWLGARLYRGPDIHLADYFFFNNLVGQGGGMTYGGFDLAILVQTGVEPLYAIGAKDDEPPMAQRQHSVLVAQYKLGLGDGLSALHFLTEGHLLPHAKRTDGPELARRDYGFAGGVRLRLEVEDGSFNDVSVKVGNRIANGAVGGLPSYVTFGLPDAEGTYRGAYGVELVEHFLINIDRLLSLNGYGTMHYGRGASGQASDRVLDFGTGARATFYLHDNFHFVTEAEFQGIKRGGADLGTAIKLTVMPTLVPTGERVAWARPQLRLLYTAGFYNDAAIDQMLSPYLRAVGPMRVAHYVGLRSEWWF